MDKFTTANNIFSYKIKSSEQPKLLTEVGGSHIWDYYFALCKTSAVLDQSSVSAGHKLEKESMLMAQQTVSLWVFRVPLTPASPEGCGNKKSKATGKEQCGRNKSQFPRHHEQLHREDRVRLGLSERTNSCVGSRCKLAEIQSRNDFQGNTCL